MNDKDKEAFEKWWRNLYDNHVEFRDWQGCDITVDSKEDLRYGWQAACEYKQKEIDELKDRLQLMGQLMTKLENSKLKMPS